MGSENLFRKRKAKKATDLNRRKSRRAAYAKVLIVCEGEKTEPYYFQDIKNFYQLNSANIEISNKGGSSPIGIWQYSNERYTQERNAGDPFDKVYCVFDKDTHNTYQDACTKIAATKPKDTFYAITSVPCFEYWLLLHFTYSTAAYVGQPGNSAGMQIEAALKQYWPEYGKGLKDAFTQRLGQLDVAKNNAVRALAAANGANTDNPTTHVHTLVEFLQNIK